MKINQLESLRVIKAISDSGNFSRAAEKLGFSVARVSKAVENLENSLNVSLFIRNTRSVQLTHIGQLCCQYAESMLCSWDEFIDELNNENQKLQGEIKVCAPVSWGYAYLTDLFNEFQEKHSGITFHIDLDDNFINVADSDYDLVFRLSHKLEDSTLIVQKLQDYIFILCCSADYYATNELPLSTSELNAHPLLAYSQVNLSVKPWRFHHHNQTEVLHPQPTLKANNSLLIKQWIMKSKGIAFIPSFLIQQELDSGEIISLLNAYRGDRLSLYLLRHNKGFLPNRVRTFITFLGDKFLNGEQV
ncbi:LysR family transcriptional regulator [Shewanella sp. 202IG2-18]|uniref:LysR family transcriptional regulator n=1 Tax=Parashewanella hymeniacidonis TaxID=2807618 RepID=UPI001961C93B|nr:LysR family transcriptional regulator [Parashewanella hymeniacidonis]MBM7074428.1 LysR family transcriptional regulator [Parashewanella hymeniacidonis]